MTASPGEIPGFGKGVLPPSAHEADSFLEEVDDVTRLVVGLRSGKVSAEYVDRVLREKDEETVKSEEDAKKKEEDAEKNKYENLPPEKKLEVKQKVEDMIREKERREKARELYAKYQESLDANEKKENAGNKSGTDYQSWDLWTPSDDEEDPWMQYMPDNPAFKSMEADIDKRHAKQVRNRQTAFRKRNEGNAALKAGQVSDALSIYESGLECDKRSIELHGNASLASLKLGCFAQCIEHCDKACELADFLLEQPKHATKIKCLLRRSAARDALGHLNEAVADLELALDLDPEDKEIVTKLTTARRKKEDAKAERDLAKRMDKSQVSTSTSEEQNDYANALSLEKLMRRVGADASMGDNGTVDYSDIESLLIKSEACRVFIRGGGGVGISKLVSRLDRKSDTSETNTIGALKALLAACIDDESICESLTEKMSQTHVIIRFIARNALALGERSPDTENAENTLYAMEVLRLCSQHLGCRKNITRAFAEIAKIGDNATSPFKALTSQMSVPMDWVKLAYVARNVQTAITLLGNLFAEREARALVRSDIGRPDVQDTELFPHCIARWVQPNLSKHAEKTRLAAIAAIALGNLCQDPEVRAAAVEGDAGKTLPGRLLLALPTIKTHSKAEPAGLGGMGLTPKSVSKTQSETLSDEQVDAAVGIFACLANILLNPAALLLVDTDTALETLMPWLEEENSNQNSELTRRACTVLTRCAKIPDVARRLRSNAGAGGAVTVAKFLSKRVEACSGPESSDEDISCLNSAVLLLTQVVVAPGVDVRETAEQTKKMLRNITSSAGASLVQCIGCDSKNGVKFSDQCVGNACLTIGALAKSEELLPALSELNPIPSLLQTCKNTTGSTQKNAAIACAKLAKHPAMMDTLRENHGIELIYSYVKP